MTQKQLRTQQPAAETAMQLTNGRAIIIIIKFYFRQLGPHT